MKNDQRILGLDIIRFLSFIAIAVHHFDSELWYSHDSSPFIETFWYWKTIGTYSKLITFSGQTILFLTSFLIAMTAKAHEKAIKIVPLMLVAWFIFSLIALGDAPFLLTWDIFPLIALGFSLVWLCYKYLPSISEYVPFLGFFLLLIPFWKSDYLNSLPLLYKHILVGDCQKDIADWPVLPWIGLIFLGYGLGFHAKNHFVKLKKIIKKEAWLWGILLIWNPLFWGKYYSITLGDRFACDVLTQEPIVFMAHLLPVAFLMRLSLLDSVQGRLQKNSFCLKLSRLQLNKKFGIAYFVHFIIIDLIVEVFGSSIDKDPLGSFLSVILILPLTELSLRGFNYFQMKYLRVNQSKL
jgi:hypothetical protein